MIDPSPTTLALLTLAALVAGTVDAIAGGGGLLTLPALLAAGLPAHLALGTNKAQSVFGSATALWRFWRGGLIDADRARVAFAAGFAGSLLGASLVLLLAPAVLRPLVVALLVAVGVFMATRRHGQAPLALAARLAAKPTRQRTVAVLIAALIGTYDGFFGPGTGTFLIVAFVALLGDSLVGASAAAKAVNFASNLAAVLLFALHGTVLWRVALPMAVAQFAGGWIGAHLAMRRGEQLVRATVLLVVFGFVVKLGHDMWVASG